MIGQTVNLSLKLTDGEKILKDFNPIALRKTKIIYNFRLSECSRVN